MTDYYDPYAEPDIPKRLEETHTSNWNVVAPYDILFKKGLSFTEFKVYALISTLTSKEGFCFPTNSYLAKACEVTNRAITKSLSKLVEKALIVLKTVDNQRLIYLRDSAAVLNLFNEKNTEKILMPKPIVRGGTLVPGRTPVPPLSTNRVNSSSTHYNNKRFKSLSYKTSLQDKDGKKTVSIETFPSKILENKSPRKKSLETHFSPDFSYDKNFASWVNDSFHGRTINIDEQLEMFKEYYLEGEGVGVRRKNWTMSFKNWIKRSVAWRLVPDTPPTVRQVTNYITGCLLCAKAKAAGMPCPSPRHKPRSDFEKGIGR